MSEERFDRIDARLDRLELGQNELRADVGRLKTEVAGLKTDVAGLKTEVSDLGRHMRVLHEQTMARIAAIREYNGPTSEEWAAMFERLNRRLDPLELTVRQHSIDIERLKEQRG